VYTKKDLYKTSKAKTLRNFVSPGSTVPLCERIHAVSEDNEVKWNLDLKNVVCADVFDRRHGHLVKHRLQFDQDATSVRHAFTLHTTTQYDTIHDVPYSRALKS